MRIGIDVGGTFTDFFVLDASRSSRMHKVLSTPDDPSIAVVEGLSELARFYAVSLRDFLAEVELIVHGTTVTTNAILTGAVARTALVTTRGFRDALEMRRGVRERLYDNKYAAPAPLVPRTLRLPIRERVDHRGAIIEPIDLADVDNAADLFGKNGIEAVAVCFMHAYAEPAHEEAAAKRLRELLPGAYLSVSSRVLPQVRFYERVSTTVLNAAVGPILQRYLQSLTSRLAESGYAGVLLVMQSNGGVTTPAVVSDVAASTLLSGPAAAPLAGLSIMRRYGQDSFITVDMGGTSFDAALVRNGRPAITTHGSIERMALSLPSMEIVTIGAGGGSIAWIDGGGLLRMGPQSAGAKPGPVCYGRGGSEPTCSDANLVLGYLNKDFFAGGRLRLDADAAFKAITERIAEPLGIETVAAAAGMYKVMNVNMASAIREISVQKGYDPREFPLICAGGAGAIHAAMIARELGIRRVLVPHEASIFCASGMLHSDLKHDFVRSHAAPLIENEPGFPVLLSHLDDMAWQGEALLASEGVERDRQRRAVQLDLRYTGQYHEVAVEVPEDALRAGDLAAIRSLFHAEHNRLYGYDLAAEGTPVDLVNIRLTATGLVHKPEAIPEPKAAPDPAAARKGCRPVFLPEREAFADTEVYDGDALRHGHSIRGPALIESVNTTILVPSGFDLVIDAFGTAVLSDHSEMRA